MKTIARHRRAIAWSIKVSIFALAGTLAYLLRFDFSIGPVLYVHVLQAVATWVFIKAIVFAVYRADRESWRYTSTPDLVRVVLRNVVSSAAAVPFMSAAGIFVPRSVYILDFMICTALCCCVRLAARPLTECMVTRQKKLVRKTLIYGAGSAGEQLARELRNGNTEYKLCGFIDDDPRKQGRKMHGLTVLGDGTALRSLADANSIEEVLVAIPSATGEHMCRILENCHDAGVTCKTIPGMLDLIRGSRLSGQIRDFAVQDLLGRSMVSLDLDQIGSKLKDKVVLVTGAAGSIGSEICRQVAQFTPELLIAFDIAETPLFHIENEMRAAFPELGFVAAVGSVQDGARLRELFQLHRPAVVFHAAAYKHVPMMEKHPFEAIENNVFGSIYVAEAAVESGTEDFVMISSDKAVRPTSIMGCTKRLAELFLPSFANDRTRFVSVRFGNVLGSNGSVIPRFREQIASGGPVTVTHPDMRRYFMAIPEAAQLVLQASALGAGSEIFVLEMGQPMKIADLAKRMIRLSGLRPGVDIDIKFVGTRPGEKLYEELSTLEESTLPTTHDKIKVFSTRSLCVSEAQHARQALAHICSSRDTQALLLLLKRLIPDYNPSADLLEQVFNEHGTQFHAEPSRNAAYQVA